MKEIKEFINKNGNVTYSNKELIGAIHIKLDRIEKQLTKGQERFAVLETRQDITRRLIIGIFSAMGGLLLLVLKLTKAL